MRKILIATLLALTTLPAVAATKPTDVIQVLAYVNNSKSPDGFDEKRYTKAWKDLKMDAATRQKILNKEKQLEKEFYMPFRVQAVRVSNSVDVVLFVGAFGAVEWYPSLNHHCAVSLFGNGGPGAECSN